MKDEKNNCPLCGILDKLLDWSYKSVAGMIVYIIFRIALQTVSVTFGVFIGLKILGLL